MKKGNNCYNCRNILKSAYILTRGNMLECLDCYSSRRGLVEDMPDNIENIEPPLGYDYYMLTTERKARHAMEIEWGAFSPEFNDMVH